MANNKSFGACKQMMGVRTRIGSKSCGGVEGYDTQHLGGNGRPRGKSWSMSCNVVGHALRRGQHEAGTVPDMSERSTTWSFWTSGTRLRGAL